MAETAPTNSALTPAQHAEIERVRKRIMADPALADKIRIVEVKDGETNYLRSALDDMNRSRASEGKQEITFSDKDLAKAEAANKKEFKDNADKALTTHFSGPKKQDARFYFQNPDVATVVVLEGGSISALVAKSAEKNALTLTDDFKQKLDAADNKGTSNILHETAHGAGGASEKIADTTMALERLVQEKEGGMGDKLKTLAEVGDLEMLYALRAGVPYDGHDTADALLRERKALLPDAQGRHTQLDEIKQVLHGQHLSTVEQVAQLRFVEPSDKALKGMQTEEMLAMGVYASEVLNEDKNRKNYPDAPVLPTHVPEQLSKEQIVTLMRLAESVKDATGNDAVSKVMPQIEQANPEAFVKARAYTKQTYGEDMSAPSTPPATPAVKTQTPAAAQGK